MPENYVHLSLMARVIILLRRHPRFTFFKVICYLYSSVDCFHIRLVSLEGSRSYTMAQTAKILVEKIVLPLCVKQGLSFG